MPEIVLGPKKDINFHKRSIERGNRLSAKVIEQGLSWLAGIAFVTLVAVMLSAFVIDGSGRDKQDHPEALPAGVSTLMERNDLFLVPNNKGIKATDICKGNASGYEPVENIVKVPNSNSSMVECNLDQSFNSDAPESTNFGGGLKQTLSSAIFLGLISPVLFVWLLYYGSLAVSDFKASGRLKNREKLSLETKRAILANQWAKDEISDEQFESKLAQLVAQESNL